MEWIDIHYCHQKVYGVWMGPILSQRLGNPSNSVQDLADRWFSFEVVLPGTVPANVTEGFTSDVASAYLTTLDSEATHWTTGIESLWKFHLCVHKILTKNVVCYIWLHSHATHYCNMLHLNVENSCWWSSHSLSTKQPNPPLKTKVQIPHWSCFLDLNVSLSSCGFVFWVCVWVC